MDRLNISYTNLSSKMILNSYGVWRETRYSAWSLALDHLIAEHKSNGPLRVMIDVDATSTSRIINNDYDFSIIFPSNLSRFKVEIPGFEELPEIRKYYKNKFDMKVKAYVNYEDKQSIIVVYDKNIYHSYIPISLLPKYFPWFEIELSSEDIEFLKAFETGNEPYLRLIQEGMEQNRASNELAGFFENMFRDQRIKIEREIEDYDSRINNYMSQIGSFMQSRQEKLDQLNGLSNRTVPDINAILADRPGIALNRIENGVICFTVKSFLSNWDDECDALINDDYTYRVVNQSKKAKIKKLFQDIFINRKYKLKIAANYYIDIRNYVVNGERVNYAATDHIDNPHISRWACLGQYAGLLANALKTMNFEAIFDICSASVASLNVSESPSMNYLLEKIEDNADRYGKCLVEVSSGVEKTINEVLDEYD